MSFLVIFMILLVVLIAAVWITFNLVGLLITLLIAGLIGWLADRIVPGDLPYGWLGAIVAGLAGSWLGTLILGDLGPRIGGITLIPALLGAIALAFIIELVFSRSGGRRRRTI
ncbi:MAG TPA: GlsB/YeaQ/YmgE family stress response membrane protein [Thermomicrobiales bacterium]|nr:GlsB/YeaQ/YmgE family stress response membrane protein [Thermomicrobiales bacterium]